MSSVGVQPEKIDSASPRKRFLSLSGNRLAIAVFLLVLATLAVYNQVSRFPFANLDDDRYVTDNVHVRAGLHWEGIKWAFTTYAFNWHPVTWLSHMLDCQLFHTNPAGHHYMSLLFHLLNVLLLFFVLKRATGYPWRSLMVAAVFALHPVNVESVVWIAERKNLLSMLFFLLALGAYQWYTNKPSVRRYLLIAFLFALGLMAKAQIITFPFLLLLWDYWPLRRMKAAPAPPADTAAPPPVAAKSFSWLIAEKLPLLALSIASAVVTIQAQKAVDAIAPMARYPFSLRLENAIVAYARYLGTALWPAHLAPMYPFPADMLKTWHVLAALLLLATATVVAIVARQRRYLVVGWLWFLGTLVPMIGLVQVGSQAMADRYAYLSFIGLFLIVCWGAAEWARSLKISPAGLASLSLAPLLALAAVSQHQAAYWRDNVILWSHSLQVTNDNFLAEDCLGGALLQKGNLEGAIPHFRRAAELHPSDPVSALNIAFYEQQHNHLREAIVQYQKATQITQDDRTRASAFNNMGWAYRGLGDPVQARRCFQAAVQLRPRNIRAVLGLGLVDQQLGDSALAVQAYSDALAIQRSDVVYVLLARALQQNGKSQEAQAAMEEGRRISQDFAAAQKLADRLISPAANR